MPAKTTKKKANVIKAYTDKYDGKVHLAGDTVELTDKRLKELSANGFVEPVEKPAAKDKAQG